MIVCYVGFIFKVPPPPQKKAVVATKVVMKAEKGYDDEDNEDDKDEKVEAKTGSSPFVVVVVFFTVLNLLFEIILVAYKLFATCLWRNPMMNAWLCTKYHISTQT